MRQFIIAESEADFTSHAGLGLIGLALERYTDLAADATAVTPLRCDAISHRDVLSCYVAMLCVGKSDFEAIEPVREDRFFKEALGLSKVPGAVWLRQRLDAKAGALRELTDELSLRLLARTEAPITPHKGYACVDIDTFAMDNGGTAKEGVGRTYAGVDGYCPLASYIGPPFRPSLRLVMSMSDRCQ